MAVPHRLGDRGFEEGDERAHEESRDDRADAGLGTAEHTDNDTDEVGQDPDKAERNLLFVLGDNDRDRVVTGDAHVRGKVDR